MELNQKVKLTHIHMTHDMASFTSVYASKLDTPSLTLTYLTIWLRSTISLLQLLFEKF